MKKIGGFQKAVEVLRGHDETMSIQMVAVFLYIALNPRCTTKQIADALGLAQSSISRNTMFLCDVSRKSKPGLRLIEDDEDPAERRRKIYFISKKGQAVVSQIEDALA